MLKESLLAAALSFPSWYGDVETEEQRHERLETIAEAIDRASARAVCADGASDPFAGETSEAEEAPPCKPLWHGSRRQLGFLLLTQAFFETRLALHVHQGKCRSHLGECDSGRATSLWQLQAGGHLPKERWETLSGTDVESTTRAAFEASKALSRGRNYCKSISGAIALYATGRTCRWDQAKRRERFWNRLMSKY